MPAAEMPMIRGIDVPRSFYWVLRDPAPLAGMAYPGAKTPWRTLHDLGFRHVVCLAARSPGYDPSPLQHVYSEELQDLVAGLPPKDPAREERLSGEAARTVIARVLAGEGMIVHCVGGTGRTGTVLGCVLKSLGFAIDEVVAHLRTLSEARGKRPGWPESPWQRELVERYVAVGAP
jgi:hypothetical protein